MKLHDALAGVLIVIFGAVVMAMARTFPPMPGQPVGPGLLPTTVGGLLIVLGALLTISGVRARRHGATAPVEFAPWTRRPRMIGHLVVVIALVVFYLVVADRLGFFITAFVVLGSLFVTFGVRRIWIAPLAVLVTLTLHYAFYTLLHVALPWGMLEGLAW